VLTATLLTAFNPSPMTGEGNNTYLLVGDGRATLIDAGIGEPRHLAAVDETLRAHRARLESVLVTHGHSDHASGAEALARAYPAARFYKRFWPARDPRYHVTWLPLDEGDRLLAGDEALTVMLTPGHSPDHVAFWHEGTKTAFTGDLVVSGTTVAIDASHGGDLGQYLAALERVRALRPTRLLPAHGPEVTDPASLLTRYLEHRLLREQQVIGALADGRDTVQAIAESIYHGRPGRPGLSELPELTPALVPAARENVRAHLEKLRQEGRAFEEHGRWHL
jgi:glyoxylase-like metal-dependent hydrolase (beta-lactamase superfamily II)